MRICALTPGGLDLQNTFLSAGASLEYLGQGRISRSLGHMTKNGHIGITRPRHSWLVRLWLVGSFVAVFCDSLHSDNEDYSDLLSTVSSIDYCCHVW